MSSRTLAEPPGAVRSLAPLRARAAARGTRPRDHEDEGMVKDAFPRTRRPLPWFLAVFMVMLFLVPMDATELKVHLPVNSHPDRFMVLVLILAWVVFGGDQRAFINTKRSKLFVGAAACFLFICFLSLVADAPRIINLGEFSLSEKKFALLGSYLALSWFALTALRYEDLRGFVTFIISLGSLMAFGMMIERRTGYNPFYELGKSILSPVANVAASPTNIHGSPATEGRVIVVGPTVQGLAATAVMVMVMPFALVRALDTKVRRTRWLNAAAFALLTGGAVATDKKTALLVPLALVIYMAIYRPRQVLKWAPLGVVVLIGFVHVVAPGSLGTLVNLGTHTKNGSTEHRKSDFTDVKPDVLAHPLLGRGYGALDSDHPGEFRINDDQYVDEIWEVGVLGLLAFVWMILSPVVLARKAIKTRGPTISSLALAASGGCIAFLVVCGLLDAMGFTEAPYMFFFLGALTTIAAAGPEGNVVPARVTRRLAREKKAAAHRSAGAPRELPLGAAVPLRRA